MTTKANLVAKLILGPAIVLLAAGLLPNVQYGAWYEPILVGLTIGAAGYMTELIMLSRQSMWISTFADLALAFGILFVVSNAFAGASVTWFGALLTALMIAVTEHVAHIWLVETARMRRAIS